MPIFSYIALPRDGAKADLCAELSRLPHCRIIPADNHQVVVLITDTPDEATEEALQERLKNLRSLQSLDLAFGHSGYDEN